MIAPYDLTDLFDSVSFWLFWLPVGIVVLAMVAAMLVAASPLIGLVWLVGVIRQRNRRAS